MEQQDNQQEQPKVPSNQLEMVRVFRYRGYDVLIRKWCNKCYEFLVSIDGKIYCNFYEHIKSTGKDRRSENEQLINEIIHNLSSSAVATIDYHLSKRSSIMKLVQSIKETKEKIQITLQNYVKHFRKRIAKQKESAA